MSRDSGQRTADSKAHRYPHRVCSVLYCMGSVRGGDPACTLKDGSNFDIDLILIRPPYPRFSDANGYRIKVPGTKG